MIGLLGGTFNPVHLGHLALAQGALQALALAEVRMVLAAHPYHKDSEVAPYAHRLAMLELACANDAALAADDSEADATTPSFTVELLERRPASEVRVWLIGEDAFVDLLSWYRWWDLFDLANFAVVPRRGSTGARSKRLQSIVAPRTVERLDPTRHGQVIELALDLPEISSTAIRHALRTGAGIEQLLPSGVCPYIRKHKLYGEKVG